MIFRLVAISAFATISVAPLAGATITVIYGGEMFSAVAGATTTNFDSTMNLPLGFSSTGMNVGVIPKGQSDLNVYEAPTRDTTNFAYVSGDSTLTDTFESPISYLGIYWGSPDTYNTLILTDASGASVSYKPGGTIPDLIPDQTTAAYVNFFDTGSPWVSATFQSNGPAFEFDNVATELASPSPEPGQTFIAGGAIIVIGLLRRRKRV